MAFCSKTDAVYWKYVYFFSSLCQNLLLKEKTQELYNS